MCVITVDIKSLIYVIINFTHIYDFYQFKWPEYQLKVVSLMQL
jgi:hypothetical protein